MIKEMNQTELRFNGPVYNPERDNKRLKSQIQRIYHYMAAGGWHTFDEIHSATGDPHTSISAQLRHLRKERFGEHTIDKRHRGEPARGLYEYRLTINYNSEVSIF